MSQRAASISDRMPPWTLAVGAMLSVQLGAALSVPIIDAVGAAGAGWLRLTIGALLIVLVVRPPWRQVSRPDLPVVLGLGVANGLMTLCFSAAIARIPLGTTVAIEFLGPLTVAALRSPDRRALVWPVVALAGVVVLTEPWEGALDVVGIGFALLAAIGWGVYIILTQRLGDRFSGLDGLALTIPVAALVAAPFGIPEVVGRATPAILLAGLGLAVLFPLLPFALELTALRRMTTSAFGTLMSVEPALGAVLGLVILHQQATLQVGVGILLVVLAGVGSQRRGLRSNGPADPATGIVGIPAADDRAPTGPMRAGPERITP